MIWYEYAARAALLLFLAAAAFMDMRTKTLPIIYVAGIFASGTALRLITGSLTLVQLLLGGAVGAVLLGIAFASRGALGYGDALMFIASGAWLGVLPNLYLLLLACTLSALASLVLLIFFKFRGRSEVPFMPFMFSGYICLLLII